MEKRMLLAIGLSILIVMIFTHLQQPTEPPPQTAEQLDGEQADGADTETTDELQSEDQDTAAAASKQRQVSETIELSADTVAYQTEHLKGFFDRRGARRASVELTEFSRLASDTLLYDLAGEKNGGFVFENSHPTADAQKQIYDLLKSEDETVFPFETRFENGARITKTYQLDPEKPYEIKLTVLLENPTESSISFDKIDFPVGTPGKGGAALSWGPGFGIEPEEETRFDHIYFYYGKEGSMHHMSPGSGGGIGGLFSGDNDNPQFERGPLDWSAVANRYFIAAVSPEKPYNLVYLDDDQEKDFRAWNGYSPFNLNPGEKQEYRFDLYLGPKRYYDLQDFHPGLEATLNYGWFTFLALPLLAGLNFIYSLIPNYGIAIIILSVLIKLILHPLTKKGLVSMQKMRDLQPEIKKIQEKYKDDKEELNKKIMAFYQKNNLNPVGGCMPMLLQLPIFIALYRMLQYSIELRGAHFMFWITDLSSRDPYYILPILMGLLMFFQQKQSLSGGGAGAMGQQKTMAYVMPVMFVFIFMNFPVGLVLYWMTNSAATLGQQWLISRSTE
ncbi:MAG: membrane protein insertase YidC [bacterium]